MSKTDVFGEPPFLRVTQVRSSIGQPPKTRATLRSLGLRKIGSQKVLPNSPSTRGMLLVARHALRVEPSGNPREIEVEEGQGEELDSPQVRLVEDTFHVSFPIKWTPGRVDAELHRYFRDDPQSWSYSVRWDLLDGTIREFTSTPAERPDRAMRSGKRIALLRLESGSLAVGIEPPLTFASDHLLMYLVFDRDITDRALEIASLVGGDECARKISSMVQGET